MSHGMQGILTSHGMQERTQPLTFFWEYKAEVKTPVGEAQGIFGGLGDHLNMDGWKTN